jgi:hypothetical protein
VKVDEGLRFRPGDAVLRRNMRALLHTCAPFRPRNFFHELSELLAGGPSDTTQIVALAQNYGLELANHLGCPTSSLGTDYATPVVVSDLAVWQSILSLLVQEVNVTGGANSAGPGDAAVGIDTSARPSGQI